MSWLWFALRDDSPPGASIAVEASDDAGLVGHLAVWPRDAKRPKGGTRIDSRAIDPQGPEAWISLVLAPPSGSLFFDDPAGGAGHPALRRRQPLAVGSFRVALSSLAMSSA